jgi:hypothetical protein
MKKILEKVTIALKIPHQKMMYVIPPTPYKALQPLQPLQSKSSLIQLCMMTSFYAGSVVVDCGLSRK